MCMQNIRGSEPPELRMNELGEVNVGGKSSINQDIAA